MENNRNYCIVLIVSFAFFNILFMPIVNGQETSSISVQITSHRNEETVSGYKHTFKGVATGLNDPNLHFYILVHPVDTDSWWVQPFPCVNQDGSWISTVYVGERWFWGAGNNQDFVIKTILTNVTSHPGDNFNIINDPFSVTESQIIIHRHDVPDWPIIIGIFSLILGFIGFMKAKSRRSKDPAGQQDPEDPS